MNEKEREFAKETLERVNYWLQFAEAKNAALIALLTALLAIDFSVEAEDAVVIKMISAIFLSTSLIISLLSFFPKYDKDANNCIGNCCASDNIVFWKDISKYSKREFLKRIAQLFDVTKIDDELVEFYIEEAIINSRIALYKYNLFKISIIISIIGIVLLPIISIIIA